MTIKEFIEKLSKFDQNMQLMCLDGFNGSGVPREVNIGPLTYDVQPLDAEETVDCEDLVGTSVCVIGYGSY